MYTNRLQTNADILVLKGVLYATTSVSDGAKARLDAAVSSLLVARSAAPDAENAEELPPPKVLYSLYYEQAQLSTSTTQSPNVCLLPSSSLDLAFDDGLLENVEAAWKRVMGTRDGEVESEHFLAFPDREGMGGDDEED